MLAIAGSSGSGKTTLLHVIAGRTKINKGDVYINGYKYASDMRRRISLILQDDIFLNSSTYTVRDHLHFNCALKSNSKLKYSERVLLIDEMTMRLGINHIIDIPIELISGGEKKRTSIAAALFGESKVLLIDEGSSGLDSGSALALQRILKQLSEESKVTIIQSIHQPSSQIYNLFSKLLVLCEGKTVYYGQCNNLLDFLSSAGLTSMDPIVRYSPLDYILDVLYVDDAKKLRLLETWNNDEIVPVLDGIIESYSINGKRSLIKYPSNYFRQLFHLFLRSLKSSSANALSALNILQTIFVAIVTGVCWLQLESNLESNVGNVGGYLFFINSYWLFAGMFGGLLEFIPELKVFELDRRAGLYRLSAYFLSKTISCLPAKILLPTIFCLISFPMVIVPFDSVTFSLVASCIILTSLMGESLGIFIGTFTHNTNQAISICVITAILVMILGGFYVKNLWVYIEWFKYISFLRYSFFATIKVMYQNQIVYCDHAGNFISFCRNREYVDGNYVVMWLGASESNIAPFGSIIFDISICLLFFFSFRVFSYLSLRFNLNQYKLQRDD